MTREEAIAVFKGFKFLPREMKAVEMAIKALEQEPTTKTCRTCRNFGSHHGICEICKDNKCWTEKEPTTKNDLGVDCISRQTVLDLINADWKYENLEIEINNLPSVTPQERKGQWIECMPGGAEEWCYKCSECNFWKYKKTINLSKFKYCPNCGSDNREVEE